MAGNICRNPTDDQRLKDPEKELIDNSYAIRLKIEDAFLAPGIQKLKVTYTFRNKDGQEQLYEA